MISTVIGQITITNWITILVAIVIIINGWFQMWVKECIINPANPDRDYWLSLLRHRIGNIWGYLSILIALVLVSLIIIEVSSDAPVTRLSCLIISFLISLFFFQVFAIREFHTSQMFAHIQKQLSEQTKGSGLYEFMNFT